VLGHHAVVIRRLYHADIDTARGQLDVALDRVVVLPAVEVAIARPCVGEGCNYGRGFDDTRRQTHC